MNKVCGYCGSTEVVVHNDVEMATCRKCGFAGSVLCFDDMTIACWLSKDTHALAELFVVRQFNSLYGIVENVEPVSWYSILIPDKTFKSRQEAVSESVNVLNEKLLIVIFVNLWKKCESIPLRQKARERMSKMCKNCRYFATTGSSSGCTLYCCATSDGENCRNYEVSTLFDRITQSPEVLAEKLVFYDSDGYYHSTIVFCKMFPTCLVDFNTEAEAIAATVAKLKEICNE